MFITISTGCQQSPCKLVDIYETCAVIKFSIPDSSIVNEQIVSNRVAKIAKKCREFCPSISSLTLVHFKHIRGVAYYEFRGKCDNDNAYVFVFENSMDVVVSGIRCIGELTMESRYASKYDKIVIYKRLSKVKSTTISISYQMKRDRIAFCHDDGFSKWSSP